MTASTLCGWCKLPLDDRDRGRGNLRAYCDYECWQRDYRRRKGLYRSSECPRCGLRDLWHESADYAICLTCGYFTGSDRGSGKVAPENLHRLFEVQSRLDEKGIPYVGNKAWEVQDGK